MLIAGNNAVMVAAKAMAVTIPIVFATGDDPVKLGFVAQIRDEQAAARALAQQIQIANASSESDFDTAFVSFAQQRVDAVIFGGDAFFTVGHAEKSRKFEKLFR